MLIYYKTNQYQKKKKKRGSKKVGKFEQNLVDLRLADIVGVQ